LVDFGDFRDPIKMSELSGVHLCLISP
jgi:hypothetical protein